MSDFRICGTRESSRSRMTPPPTPLRAPMAADMKAEMPKLRALVAPATANSASPTASIVTRTGGEISVTHWKPKKTVRAARPAVVP